VGVLAFIKAFFTGIGKLFEFLNNKQLLDAGEAKAQVKVAEKVAENEEIANNAAADPVVLDFVRNKYRRD
jgi:hypothetical protein